MGRGFLVRLLAACVLLFATYNPEGRSYFHWLAADNWTITPLKAFVAIAFFGTLIWLIVSWAHLEPHTSRGLTYLILVGIAAVLATGSAWSIVRRRLTGQVDVEEQKS